MATGGGIMKKFWEDHSKDGSVREMMLDDNAEAFSELEKAELLSLLPPVTNKDVLELGAGIGRFSGDLAQKAKSVVAVDFMENFVQLNKKSHNHYGNIDFVQADVNHLRLPANRFDILFSNWLMMYLSDDDVRKLARNALTWLREDGYFFFRESCFHRSGNKKRGFNPTEYRTPSEYNELIRNESVVDDDGSICQFELLSMQSVKTYIEIKGNCNQICWLMRKVNRDVPEMVQNSVSSNFGLLQWICGESYMVTGGNSLTKFLVSHLNFEEGSRLLDYGTGLGGSAFYVSQEFCSPVRAVCSRADAITLAMRSANVMMENRVAFEVQADSMFVADTNVFDGVMSRDHFCKVHGKSSLLRIFMNGLKPGKRLVLADICGTDDFVMGDEPEVDSIIGPYIITMQSYQEIIASSGLTLLEIEDETDIYLQHLKQEYNKLSSQVPSFLDDFSMDDFIKAQEEWLKKIEMFESGNLKWMVLVAEKKD